MGLFQDGTSNLDADQLNQKVQAGGDVRNMALLGCTIDLTGLDPVAADVKSNYGFDASSFTETSPGSNIFQISFLVAFLDYPAVTWGIRRLTAGSSVLGYSVQMQYTGTTPLKTEIEFQIFDSAGAQVVNPACTVHFTAFGPIA